MNNPSQSNLKGVSIIIVLYNSEKYISKCLKSIMQFKYEFEYEIILVDNDSKDNSLNSISNLSIATKIIRNKINQGFSKATNQGIKLAQYDYIFLLNPDTTLLNDALNTFIEFMDQNVNKNIWCVGAQLLDENGDPNKSYGRFPNLVDVISEQIGIKGLLLKLLDNKYLKNRNLINRQKIVPYVIGCDMFMRRKVLEKIGLFNEMFFLNYEETELSWRARQAGYKSMIVPEAKILHYTSKSFKSKIEYMLHFWNGQIVYFKLARSYLIYFFAKILHLMGTYLRIYLRREIQYYSRLKFLNEL